METGRFLDVNQAENELARYRNNLEQMVSERTVELKSAQNNWLGGKNWRCWVS